MKSFEDILVQVLASSAPTRIAATVGTDAVVTYTSLTTITVATTLAFDESNILFIVQQPAGGKETIYHTTRRFWSVAGGIITVSNATFAVTDKFIVVFMGQDVLDDILLELIDIGLTLDNTLIEVTDQGTTLDNTLIELTDQGTTLDNTLIEVTDQGLSLDLLVLLGQLIKGSELYFAGPMTNADGTAVYNDVNKVLLASLPFTAHTFNVVQLEVIRVADGTRTTYTHSQCTIAANIITVSGTPAFAAGDSFYVVLTGQRKAHVPAINSDRTYVVNSRSQDTQNAWTETNPTAVATNFTLIEVGTNNPLTLSIEATDCVVTVSVTFDYTAALPAEGGVAGAEWQVYAVLDTHGDFTHRISYPLNMAVYKILVTCVPNNATSYIQADICTLPATSV